MDEDFPSEFPRSAAFIRALAYSAISASLDISSYYAMQMLAQEFGFKTYTQFADWHDRNKQVTLECVRGPYALQLLKAYIVKHGYKQP